MLLRIDKIVSGIKRRNPDGQQQQGQPAGAEQGGGGAMPMGPM